MRLLLIFVLAATTGFISACRKTGAKQKDSSLNIKLHECNNTVFSDNQTRLCFDSVISDSRCPANVTCVWEGIAVCKFSFFANNQLHPVILSTYSPGIHNQDTVLGGYKIELINLLPYPAIHADSGSDNEIKAEVKITKL